MYGQSPPVVPRSAALREAYFGDLHLHTSFSPEVYAAEVTTTPDQAYRYARGEPLEIAGETVRRPWPLDFLAVSDHAEHLGVLNGLNDPDSAISKSAIGELMQREPPGMPRLWHLFGLLKSGQEMAGFDERTAFAAAWAEYITAANANYLPGRFTTFIAYEWSGDATSQYNLQQTNSVHRGVIFGADRAPLPFTALDSRRPEDLWTYLEKTRRDGIEVFAIANHPNLSGGLAYAFTDSDGRPIDRPYAARRALNEPLSEIAQHHGSAETHPELSPEDEFAHFEISERLFASQEKSAVHGSYVREAYGRGLLLQRALGVNPFKFGVVGTSDFHNGLSDSSEGDYAGDTDGGITPRHPLSAERLKHNLSRDNELNTIDMGSGYLTGVWAQSNTRESIFAALKGRETFATSGTRIKLRFFGGWRYSKSLKVSGDWLKAAYAGGVPMGGDLPSLRGAATTRRAPRFIVWALKAPQGANLDRLQIVKVWVDGENYREKVFNVAYSGFRTVDPKTGRLSAVGNTANVTTATYTNDIGASQLSGVWEDPQFDAATPATYYLRALEIPTPRWTTIQSVKVGVPLPHDASATLQERAWTSPIWYTPLR